MSDVSLNMLMALVAQQYTCDPESYPELAGMTEAEKLRFEIRHSALHFSKSAGALASISEDIDHGGEMNVAAVQRLVPKALINALKLAQLAGVTAEQLAAEYARILSEVNGPVEQTEKVA